MLSASRMNRWSDVRRLRRAVALPFVGVFVGLFLTTTSASTRTLRAGDAALSVEAASLAFECAYGLLHAPATVLDAQRRVAAFTSDLHASHADAFVVTTRADIALVAHHELARTASAARGYDATAPPFRFV